MHCEAEGLSVGDFGEGFEREGERGKVARRRVHASSPTKLAVAGTLVSMACAEGVHGRF